MVSDTKTTLELYVGSLGDSPTFESQERIIDRLDSMVTAGTIDDYTVTAWGDRVTPRTNTAHTSVGNALIHKLLVFRQWCHRNDADVSGLYDVERTTIAREPHTTFALAPLVVAEYEGARLRFVSPYVDDEQSVSVTTHLDAITGAAERRLVARTDAVTTEDPARSGARNDSPRQAATPEQ